MKSGAVLITGGGSGIGAACAAAFFQSGRPVVLVGRSAKRLKETTHALGDPQRLLALAGDVGDEKFARSVFVAAQKRFGGVDVLVNNAAILIKKLFIRTTAADWDATLRTNVRGPFLFSREFLRAKNPGRVIVNIGSLGGVHGTQKFPELCAYTVSKYALTGLTAALAVEARTQGVKVFCVAPGAVDTAMLRKALPRLRAGAVPADIARVVLKMVDDPSPDLVTGDTLSLETNR